MGIALSVFRLGFQNCVGMTSGACRDVAALDSVQAIVPEDTLKEKHEFQHGTGSAKNQAPAGMATDEGTKLFPGGPFLQLFCMIFGHTGFECQAWFLVSSRPMPSLLPMGRFKFEKRVWGIGGHWEPGRQL